jgi:flagellar hook-associated protein 2
MAITPTLSSPGIGSGLDVSGIVDKLMAVERAPLDQLGKAETAVQSRISAYGTLKSSLAALQAAVKSLTTPSAFRSMTAQIANTAVGTATVGDGAVAGSYRLEVTQLAQSQKLASAGFASVSDVVGSGSLTFTFGTFAAGAFTPSATAGARTVTIPAGADSLVAVRDAVNAANIGVTASIINDGSAAGQRLVFSSTGSGAANSLRITASDADGTDTDASGLSRLAFDPAAIAGSGKNMTETVAAQDALLTVDGVAIRSATNAVKDAIAGVTLNIASASPGAPTTVTIAQSAGPAGAAVSAFVKAYNEVQATITNLTKYNAATKTASVLTGDGTVRAVQTQLRSLIGGTITGASATLNTLSLVGIKSTTDGQLAMDSAKFNAALAADPRAVERLFAAAGSATDALVGYTGSTAKTVAGTYDVAVTQLAARGTLVASASAGLTITAGVDDALTATVDGHTVSVTLGAGTYASAAALAAEVASKVNGALAQAAAGTSVTIAETAGVLTFTSALYGSGSTVALSGSAAATLVGATPTATAGLDVAGSIGTVTAVGSGQSLVGATGSPAEGLKLTITGGVLGARGTVSYARGAGYALDQVLTSLLASTGAVQTRTDGLQGSITEMDKRKDVLQARLDRVHAAYLRQFNALDTQLAQLSATSNYLAQQLANLPKIGDNSKS